MEDQCKNCGHPFTQSEMYCIQCGQKSGTHDLSLQAVIAQIWISLANIDNAIWYTIANIWRPWYLTKIYVEGQRKRILHPVRLFIITLLIHFSVILSLSDFNDNYLNMTQFYRNIERSVLFEQFNTAYATFDSTETCLSLKDSLVATLFDNVPLPSEDTLFIPDFYDYLSDSFAITKLESIQMPIDSIYTKHNISGFFEKLMIRQSIRSNVDRHGAISYVLKNSSWTLLFVILIVAVIMKIMYIRHDKLYVEHLLLLFNLHSWLFLVTAMALLSHYFIDYSEEVIDIIIPFIILFNALYLLMTIRQFYRQGWLKTIAKYVCVSFFYLILLPILLFIFALISLALF